MTSHRWARDLQSAMSSVANSFGWAPRGASSGPMDTRISRRRRGTSREGRRGVDASASPCRPSTLLEKRRRIEKASDLHRDVAPHWDARRCELGMQLRPAVDDGDHVLEVVLVKVANSSRGGAGGSRVDPLCRRPGYPLPVLPCALAGGIFTAWMIPKERPEVPSWSALDSSIVVFKPSVVHDVS
jgi:hypothetical protein